MGRSSTLPSDDLALSMDVHQQVDKTTRPLYSVSGRRAAIAGFHPLRVFPRRNQDVRGDDTECGMYCIFLSSMGFVLFFPLPLWWRVKAWQVF